MKSRHVVLRAIEHAARRFHAAMLSSVGVSTRRQRSRRYLARGMRHMQKGEFFEAVVEYKAAVEEDPTDVYAVVNRGLAWLNLEDFEMARADFDTGIQLNPECAVAYLGRSYLSLRLQDESSARQDLTRALSLLESSKETGAAVHSQRAYCYLSLTDYVRAETESAAGLKLSPANVEAYSLRGQARIGLRNWEGAIADFSEAIRIGPATSEMLGCRGYASANLGRLADARSDYEELVRRDPTNLSAQCYLGYLIGRGDPFGARDHYERLLAALPEEALVKNNFAWLLSTSPEALVRDGSRAVVLATAACELSEWKVAHYVGTLAAAFAEAGNCDRAVEMQTRACELFASDERPSADSVLATIRA